ncbi:uncharacterized protein LOC144663042 isoform X1 [Oculina patagonica]
METSRRVMRFHVFNCDNTYRLDTVEALLLKMQDKHKFKILVEKRTFRLAEMKEMCETTIPKLQMDFAIFVVHAHESRLSINEDNAGIGYARFYRTLLQATGGRVLIVIGGDDQYRDEDEEERTVISRWAKRKVGSQFNDEYLDGRESFIFSWNKKHREIHEEALLHYFDPSKKGQKFVYQPKPKPVPRVKEPKITPPSAVDIPEEFGPSDDKEPLLGGYGNGGSIRRSSGQEGPKSEFSVDLEEPSFGALRVQSDSGTAPADYPEGTVLLSTRMRYGKISYEVEDVENWDQRWQPSERTVRDLGQDWKSVAVAKVLFITNASGGVFCKVIEVKPRKEGICAWLIALFILCMSWCFDKIKACVIAIFYCFWGLLILFYEWLCKK